MTAMLRAAGIPARHVSGLVFSRMTKAETDASCSFSCMGRVYADGKWHFADPTWGTCILTGLMAFTFIWRELVDISTEEFKARFEEFRKSVEDDGYKIIGAMTAPLNHGVVGRPRCLDHTKGRGDQNR